MASDDAYGSGRTITAPPSVSHPLAQGKGPDAMIGQVVDGRYRIVAKLGEGGMGEVYLCEHVGLKKRLAIKLLRAEIVTNPEAVARFHQEAQSATSIQHRNIIEIHDIGTLADKRVYMCMEFLEGQPFNEMIKQPLDAGRTLDILIQACDGLAAAHRHQIVHRDMKPENIFVTQREGRDVPKLLDFGIAKVSGNDGQNNLTRTGTIFGTPFYMAPEQALGQGVDHRADIYSVGVIMYEVFTGSVPFKAESFMAILTQHITTEPKPPQQMAAEHGRVVPPRVAEIIACCMRKDPAHRFQSMDDLKGALVNAYRELAGPGMSAYLEAQRASAAYGARASGVGAAMSGPTPMPTPMPMPTGGPQPSLHGMTSAYGEEYAPRKKRTGLVVALFVLFLGGGAAGGYVYWQSQQKGSGDQGSGDSGTTEPVKTEPVRTEPVKVEPTEVVPGNVAPDAGAPAVTEPVVTDVPKVTVLVNSKPQGAEVFLGGESLGRTPTLVEVPKGQPTELRLVRDGFETAALVVDGKNKKVTERLKKRKKGDTGHGTTTTDGGKPDSFDDDKKDDGKKDDGKKDDGKKDDGKIEDGLIDDDSDQLE